MNLPPRTADTMSDAIAMASPAGRMSKRARAAAEKRLSTALFGPDGLQRPKPDPDEMKKAQREQLTRRAKDLRRYADRGVHPRKYRREAARLEAQARELGQ